MSLRVSMSSWLISACSGDMYSKVPTTLPKPVTKVLSVRGCGRLGDAKVDDLRYRLAVVQGDQNVGRLQIAMDNALLMGMLYRLADRQEQFKPLPWRKSMFVAVLCDRNALDQVHHEVGPSRVGRATVEHPGDIRVIHKRQGLPLDL